MKKNKPELRPKYMEIVSPNPTRFQLCHKHIDFVKSFAYWYWLAACHIFVTYRPKVVGPC